MLLDENALQIAAHVIASASAKGWTITTAESCTGGLIAAALTDVPGASAVINRCFVTYANDAKSDLVGVSADILDHHGAVSEQTAQAMANGALKAANADLALSVTGIAGPGGGTPEKPVGLVHFALAQRTGATHAEHQYFGESETRRAIRAVTTFHGLQLLSNALEAKR